MKNLRIVATVGLLLAPGCASAVSLSPHAGYNPGAAVDAANLASVPLGDFDHGGAGLNDVSAHRSATSGPIGGFSDR